MLYHLRNQTRLIFSWLLFLTLIVSLVLVKETKSERKMDFWRVQRKGANFFNQVPTREWLEAAGKLGLQFIRLAPDKWESADRDFLIGNADNYVSINEQDLAKLLKVLDEAKELNLKVVITMLSLPGVRWRQHNDNKSDPRIWQDEHYQEQAIRFWKDLAFRLKGHPAIVGYDPLNEPHPGKALLGIEDVGTIGYDNWIAKSRGTTADLNRFNQRIVAAIRSVDDETPILLESGAFDSPEAYKFMQPVDDSAVLYSFHFYEPWNFTSKQANKGRFAYPEQMPVSISGETEKWDINNLKSLLQPIADWCDRYQIEPNRMVVGEFGCNREVKGAGHYLGDLILVFNEKNWHWAFYAFREDTWVGMDYEVGTGRLPWKYWQDMEAGKLPEPPRGDNPLFEVLKREFRHK